MEDEKESSDMNYVMKKKTMSYQERIELNPIKKYREYGKFPWKLLFHFLLVLLTTIQCLIMIRSTFSHTRAESRYFYYWFVNENITFTDVDYSINRFIYNIEEVRELVSHSREVKFKDNLELL